MSETTNPATFATLLVGTDGSADADRAVQWAAEMADRLQAEVVVVHAVPLLDHLPGEDDVIASTVRQEVEARLAGEWTEPLRRRDVAYQCVMEDGPPLMAIPRVAERVGAELIVVASHGMGGRITDLLGSTSHGLAAMSSVAVVIVPNADRSNRRDSEASPQ